MPGYAVREIRQPTGGREFRLRVLGDAQQRADPDGHGAWNGSPVVPWRLFGQVGPSGRLPAAEGADRVINAFCNDDAGPPPHQARLLQDRRRLRA